MFDNQNPQEDEVKRVGSDWLWLSGMRRYHPGVCHKCLKWPKNVNNLKKCAGCKLIHYCSRECQEEDWPTHKELCREVRADGNQTVFSEAKLSVKKREDWWPFCKDLIRSTSLQLGRELEWFERDIFLFPRVCEVCKDAHVPRLHGCRECNSVFYCPAEHSVQEKELHKQYCYSFFLATQCDIFNALHGIPYPQPFPFPTPVEEVYKSLPDNMLDLLSPQIEGKCSEETLKLEPILAFVLSDWLSLPLSFLFAMEKISINDEQEHLQNLREITIHVIGAAFREQAGRFVNSMEYVLHRLPNLKSLNIILIGPNLETEFTLSNDIENTNEEDINKHCNECHNKGKQVLYKEHHMVYHEYTELYPNNKPNAIIAYNCGFSSCKSWVTSFNSMIHDSSIPLIFTSFTKSEAESDLKHIQKANVEVVLDICKNPFSGQRPFRHTPREEGLFYINNYIGVVKGKNGKGAK
ncbi:unnamed protein product [Meganyctiphanes norvegica]|uniref:MYND-type domain-containing protein n=1 Tax=Meganyctiphanes norvegica TaxID=48144 RepID=A0AAV2QBR0_MEGNR